MKVFVNLGVLEPAPPGVMMIHAMMLHVSLSHSTLYSTGPVWCLLIKMFVWVARTRLNPLPRVSRNVAAVR